MHSVTSVGQAFLFLSYVSAFHANSLAFMAVLTLYRVASMSMARLTPAVFGASLRLIQSLLFIHFVLLSLGISTLSKTDSGFKLSVLDYTIYDPPRVKVIQGRTPNAR